MNEEEINYTEVQAYEDAEHSDSIEAILERHDMRKSQKADDIVAMQSVICVMLAVALLISNLLYPNICEPLYEMLKNLTNDEKEVMPNLIDVLMSL